MGQDGIDLFLTTDCLSYKGHQMFVKPLHEVLSMSQNWYEFYMLAFYFKNCNSLNYADSRTGSSRPSHFYSEQYVVAKFLPVAT